MLSISGKNIHDLRILSHDFKWTWLFRRLIGAAIFQAIISGQNYIFADRWAQNERSESRKYIFSSCQAHVMAGRALSQLTQTYYRSLMACHAIWNATKMKFIKIHFSVSIANEICQFSFAHVTISLHLIAINMIENTNAHFWQWNNRKTVSLWWCARTESISKARKKCPILHKTATSAFGEDLANSFAFY